MAQTSRRVASVPKHPQRVDRASFPIVGIGASAGGVEAVLKLLKALPAETGLALILVQHLDPTHDSSLKDLLSRVTPMPVSQVTDGMAVEPNHVYVIPPNTSMVLATGALRMLRGGDQAALERALKSSEPLASR